MVTMASTKPTSAGKLESTPRTLRLGNHSGIQWERARATHQTPQAKLAQIIAPIHVRCRRRMCRVLG